MPRDPQRIIDKYARSQAAKTIFLQKKVDKVIAEERMETCNTCDQRRRDKNIYFCGLCGCEVSNPKNRILNITLYEEERGKPLCKHPHRGKGFGQGWKR